MKLTIILTTFFLLVISCQKNDAPVCFDEEPIDMPLYLPGDMEHGSLDACRNGDDWVASGWAKRIETDRDFFYVAGYTFTDYGAKREAFYISYIPVKEGKYAIDGDENSIFGNTGHLYAHSNTSADDGDVAEDRYLLRESPQSWVEITHLDTLTNKVEGEFEVYLEVEAPKRGEQNADKLCFKRGRFSVDIIE